MFLEQKNLIKTDKRKFCMSAGINFSLALALVTHQTCPFVLPWPCKVNGSRLLSLPKKPCSWDHMVKYKACSAGSLTICFNTSCISSTYIKYVIPSKRSSCVLTVTETGPGCWEAVMQYSKKHYLLVIKMHT